MNVRELIERLKLLPPEMPVELNGCDCSMPLGNGGVSVVQTEYVGGVKGNPHVLIWAEGGEFEQSGHQGEVLSRLP